jgi:two-component system KDP operon response regulator KdpE
MPVKQNVLVVEDERSIRNYICTVLAANGFDVLTAEDGAEAYTMITSHCPDLVILDLGLPDVDGLHIIRTVRQWSKMPIVVVSARTHERDKVEALDAGADDYITKPFGTSELLARIRTAIRHTRTANESGAMGWTGIFKVKDMVIDYDKHHVTIAGTDVHLTQNEFKIVSMLAKYAGKVLTYDAIMKEVWGPLSTGDNQILRVNMANIRRKLEKNPGEPEYIFTEVGVGYRMLEEGQ